MNTASVYQEYTEKTKALARVASFILGRNIAWEIVDWSPISDTKILVTMQPLGSTQNEEVIVETQLLELSFKELEKHFKPS